MNNTTSYAGMWVTKDGYFRHVLLLNGRYNEARATANLLYGEIIPITAITSVIKTIPDLQRMMISGMVSYIMQE